jgi:hypothetical protein
MPPKKASVVNGTSVQPRAGERMAALPGMELDSTDVLPEGENRPAGNYNW